MTQIHQLILGNIRLQVLSNTLLRLESKGPLGFEDRCTFTVVNREWEGADCQTASDGKTSMLNARNYRVVVQDGGQSQLDVRIESHDGELFFQPGSDPPDLQELPGPAERIKSWVMADHPRIIPPLWGATPADGNPRDFPTSGWDTGNDAYDVYIFIPGEGGYYQFRRDFLKLTGRTPIPPLYIFGLIDSRYHPYTDKTALETIYKYRSREIPLDVFVMDTDWRIGASHGYEINTKLIPDMSDFLHKAHQKNVFIMFNDHPEPYTKPSLSPGEMKYRWDHLTRLLGMGVDIWWYDRNWITHIDPPVSDFVRDVWGQRLYHDITLRFRPDRRPLIMSNVAGIEHGYRAFPPHPAEHRYPIWWTGDTAARWDYLRLGIMNSVDYGIVGLMPYVHEDIGGHFGNPDPELYIRFVQFGMFSPIARLHCTHGETRHPWDFGPEAEQIASQYIRLRYQLLPLIYGASRRAFEDGIPLLRRCDLEWPEFPQSSSSTQYLFTDDILVAPVLSGEGDYPRIPGDVFSSVEGEPGLLAEFYDGLIPGRNRVSACEEFTLDFDWGWSRFPSNVTKTAFSAYWKGELINLPESGLYKIGVYLSGSACIRVNGKLILEAASSDILTPFIADVELNAQHTYTLEVEFRKTELRAAIWLVWRIPSFDSQSERELWLPPGSWMDAWTGERSSGPAIIKTQPAISQIPLYIREGGILFSIPQYQFTQESQWEKVIIDVIVPDQDGCSTRILYEDDGITESYLDGAFSKTPVLLERKGTQVYLRVNKPEGGFPEMLTHRTWVIRMHLPKNLKLVSSKFIGVEQEDLPEVKNVIQPGLLIIKPGNAIEQIPFLGQGQPGRPGEGDVVEVTIPKWELAAGFEFSIDIHDA